MIFIIDSVSCYWRSTFSCTDIDLPIESPIFRELLKMTNVSWPSGNDLRFYSSRTKWNKIAKTAIWISVSGYDRFLFDWLTDRFQWNLIADVYMSLGTFKHWMQIVCGILRAKKSWWKINKTSIWNYHFFNFPWFFVNSNEH